MDFLTIGIKLIIGNCLLILDFSPFYWNFGIRDADDGYAALALGPIYIGVKL